jgi:glycosyltransferase involved in cell wall biosynthesis
MSKILIVGHNPPYLDKRNKIEAAHYRTWQFLQPLIEDGHTICLCSIDNNVNHAEVIIPKEWESKLIYHTISFTHLRWNKKLQNIHNLFDPNCILAINYDACLITTKLLTDKPIWMDIYGDPLTIIQAACYRKKSNRGYPTSIKFTKEVLRKGDIFSVCSTPQAHALVGELALTGRLNYQCFGYQFTRVILPGALSDTSYQMYKQNREIIFPKGINQDNFVVLWCGGYNTWMDVDTLFTGVERAMATDPHIRYLSIGANSYKANDNTYVRFQNLVSQSRYRDRFIMLGWRPWEEISNYYHMSDIGLNIDSLHYETIYGTRTRLLEMISAGLPIVTTLGTELSYIMKEKGLALTFDPGGWQDLGDHILRLAWNPEMCKDMRKKALNCTANELSFATTTAPVRSWVNEPQKAPDKISYNLQEKILNLEHSARAKVRFILWRLFSLNR